MAEKVEREWVVTEFAGVDLGDERLNRRLIVLAGDLGGQPTAPINEASRDWKAMKAAYKFFANEQVEAEAILAPHQERTLERLRGHAVVVAIQDTTFLNYNHHPATTELGPIGGKQRGLVMPSTLAATPQGLPLGLLTQQMWARREAGEAEGQGSVSRPRPKESAKWLAALEESFTLVPAEIRLVTIADREADLCELLVTADDVGAEYVIRAVQDRRGPGEADRLWACVARQPVAGQVTVELTATPTQPARTATGEVQVAKLTLQAPGRPTADEAVWWEPRTVWAIWRHERAPPPDSTPVEWRLLTTIPIATWQETVDRITWDWVGPSIAGFHRVLKSGGTVEACRLESADRLPRYLTLMTVIAWRLFWLMPIHRQTPDAPCTTRLADHEWKALAATIHRTDTLPDTIPPVGQAVHWIACLGGFPGRQRDGEPGITVIWRAWSRLSDVAHLYLVLHPSKDEGNRQGRYGAPALRCIVERSRESTCDGLGGRRDWRSLAWVPVALGAPSREGLDCDLMVGVCDGVLKIYHGPRPNCC
ncbi:MAG TPA: IS4 family transposase [Chloroflexi bacterium]|nr:IS4 family transposase [Chloroflexota bacterium]